MNTPKAWLTSVLVLILFSMVTSIAIAGPQNPRMRKAIEFLQEAKKATKPIPLLNAAKAQFKPGKNGKTGDRNEALETIQEAVSWAKAGNRGKMEQKINHAIAQIHVRMDNSN